LTSSVIGCAPSYTEAELDAARQVAHEAGHAQGYSAGHDAGYNAGKSEGYDASYPKDYETGKVDGHKVGYSEGYDAGIVELESAKEKAERTGYNKGYKAGYDEGHSMGILLGKLEALSEELKKQAAERAKFEDLAYIKAVMSNYSDDADPEPEGISLGILFYDSESRYISAMNVPLAIDLTIYYLGILPLDYPGTRQNHAAYENTFTINATAEKIRIPFEDVRGAPRCAHECEFILDVEVTVTTPNGGVFSDTSKTFVEWG
jgi:hypothetical protein